MLRVIKIYVDESGAPILTASGWVEARDSAGLQFDFSDSTWKAAASVVTPRGVLTDPAGGGAWGYTFDESTWATRIVTFALFVADTTEVNPGEAETQTKVFIAGAITTSVNIPIPATGYITFYIFILGSTGTPTGSVYVIEGPPGISASSSAIAGVWDAVNSVLSFSVPEDCPVFRVNVPEANEFSYWSSEDVTSPVCLNTATPIWRR